jgi:signal transduction histidine kinase
VAHEINNPLTGILNYIRLMLRTFNKGPLPADKHAQFTRYLALVETETDRCSKIVASLLTFSRRSPVSVGPVSIIEILDRSIVLARHKLELGNVTLANRIADHLPDISGDANQLQQCLLNLIFNAVDAMPDGGTLTLSAALEGNPEFVVIGVSDTGHGIPEEDMAHVFEPFYTTKQEGHGIGLGLSTSYGIIDRHGGSLTAASQPGQGTTFEIRLPVQASILNSPGGAA